jgi:hypothetical protein
LAELEHRHNLKGALKLLGRLTLPGQ